MEKPSIRAENRHFDSARRLARRHLTDGHEVYPPLLSQVALLLAEYEGEILAQGALPQPVPS
jgi:hypothetical protein